MLLLARSEPPSALRTAVCVGMFVALAVLAGLGLLELKAHGVGRGILVSAALEIA
jgi:hypothetical protein